MWFRKPEEWCTFFVFGETPVIVPAWNQYHVISEVFSLDLGLLKDNYVGLKDVEHSLEGSFVSPWLVTKGIANAVDIPSGDSNAHFVIVRGIAVSLYKPGIKIDRQKREARQLDRVST